MISKLVAVNTICIGSHDTQITGIGGKGKVDGRYDWQAMDETIDKVRASDFAYLGIVEVLTKIGISRHEAEIVADTAQGLSDEDAEDYIRTYLGPV